MLDRTTNTTELLAGNCSKVGNRQGHFTETLFYSIRGCALLNRSHVIVMDRNVLLYADRLYQRVSIIARRRIIFSESVNVNRISMGYQNYIYFCDRNKTHYRWQYIEFNPGHWSRNRAEHVTGNITGNSNNRQQDGPSMEALFRSCKQRLTFPFGMDLIVSLGSHIVRVVDTENNLVFSLCHGPVDSNNLDTFIPGLPGTCRFSTVHTVYFHTDRGALLTGMRNGLAITDTVVAAQGR